METHWPKSIKIYRSPIRLLLLIAGTIFVTHTFAVAFVHPHFAVWLGSLVQSALLLLLLFPVLYFFSFGPLVLHITEREQAEAAMRDCEQKYRNLFEHLSDAAFLLDVETGRILDTNPQGERLLGRTRGEIMGMNQSKLYPPGQEEEQQKRFAAYAQQEHPGDYETVITRKDGLGVPVLIRGVPTLLHGRRLLIEFVRDLSEPPTRNAPLGSELTKEAR